jgi:hypothetical protein
MGASPTSIMIGFMRNLEKIVALVEASKVPGGARAMIKRQRG